MCFHFGTYQTDLLQELLKEEFPEALVKLSVSGPALDQLQVEVAVEDAGYITNTLSWVEGLQVLVSSDLYADQQNRGLGQKLMKVKLAFAKNENLTLMARVSPNNIRQRHILAKFAWTNVFGDFWMYTPTGSKITLPYLHFTYSS